MSRSRDSMERVDVVIVGAGASGLYCAHLLTEQDAALRIVVLEAKDRIGGRIHSVSEQVKTIEGEIKQVVVDYGAAWVHGTGYEWGKYKKDTDSNSPQPIPDSNPMMELLVENKGIADLYASHLRPRHVNGNPWIRPEHVLHNGNGLVLYVEGQRLDKDDPAIRQALDRHFTILQRVSDYGKEVQDQGRTMELVNESLQDVITQVTSSLPEDESSIRVVVALTKWYQNLWEAWYGGQQSDMQIFEFIKESDDQVSRDEVYVATGDFHGPHCTLGDGMKTVLEPLLRGDASNERIRCNQEVIRIQETETNTVIVETRAGLRFEADCCVVTMTVGCLKTAIASASMFYPALPEERTEAINALRMIGYKKVKLTFDRIFWPSNEAMIGMVRQVHSTEKESPLGNELIFDNLWACDGIPSIQAVLTGNAAIWAIGKDSNVIRDAVLDFMNDAMGREQAGLREWCTACHVTRWEEDPFTRGAYSCYTLGTTEQHTEVLRRSEMNGKLVFSGEATISEYEGSVHAALFSARNATKDVLQCLDDKS